MNNAPQNQEAPGSNLQNTGNVQQGEQTGGLQPQSSYRQVQQDVLGSDAYRNYDGLKVQNSGGSAVVADPVRQFGTNEHAWPSVWVWVVAVLGFIIFINIRNTIKKGSRGLKLAQKTEVATASQEQEPVAKKPAESLAEAGVSKVKEVSVKPKSNSKAKAGAKKSKKSAKKARK